MVVGEIAREIARGSGRDGKVQSQLAQRRELASGSERDRNGQDKGRKNGGGGASGRGRKWKRAKR